jgi:preprotein translocase subunit SecF
VNLLEDLSSAMLVGIIVGTYSSLFIATPVLVDTISKEDKKKRKSTSRSLV